MGGRTRKHPPEETLDETRFLLSVGESVDQVTKTLGLKHSGLAKVLRIAGDPDLARVFENRGRKLKTPYALERDTLDT